MTKKQMPEFLLAVCTLAFILIFATCNVLLSKETTKRFLENEIDFSTYTKEVHTEYVSDDLKGKYAFLNLNGLFARINGRRVYNDSVLLKNGMLTRMESKPNMAGMGDGIAELAQFVERQGGQFLYVQAPYKVDLEGQLLPDGMEGFLNPAANELLNELRENGVNTLDLRPYLSATPKKVEKYFFKTDHHWNYTGAFVGFQETVKYLSEMYPEDSVDSGYTDINQWESYTIKNQFLGSIGKRVGTLYAGTDDLTCYVPKFETKMSCAVPKYRDLFKGDFSAANMRQQYLEEKNYFKLNNYCAYIGDDYPLVLHRNAKAPSDKKVFLIKDSYSLPFQSYLSTVFQEVDVIDPRIYTDSTIAEYILMTKPDIVLMLINPSQFGTKVYFKTGTKEALETQQKMEKTETIMYAEKISIEPKDASYNFQPISVEYGKRYELSIDDIAITAGDTEGVVTALYDATTKTLLSVNVFDIDYCREKSGFYWAFRTPDSGSNELQLLLYAGTHDHNRGTGVIYKGVTLSANTSTA